MMEKTKLVSLFRLHGGLESIEQARSAVRVVGMGNEKIIMLESTSLCEVFNVVILDLRACCSLRRVRSQVIRCGQVHYDVTNDIFYFLGAESIESASYCLQSINLQQSDSSPELVFSKWGRERPEEFFQNGFIFQCIAICGDIVYASGTSTALFSDDTNKQHNIGYASELIFAYSIHQKDSQRHVAGGGRDNISIRKVRDGTKSEAMFYAICRLVVAPQHSKQLVVLDIEQRADDTRASLSHIRRIHLCTGTVNTVHTVSTGVIVDLALNSDGSVYFATTLSCGGISLRLLGAHDNALHLIVDDASHFMPSSVKMPHFCDTLFLDDTLGHLSLVSRTTCNHKTTTTVLKLKVPSRYERYIDRVMPIILAFDLLDRGRATLRKSPTIISQAPDSTSLLALLAQCGALRHNVMHLILAFAFASPGLFRHSTSSSSSPCRPLVS